MWYNFDEFLADSKVNLQYAPGYGPALGGRPPRARGAHGFTDPEIRLPGGLCG